MTPQSTEASQMSMQKFAMLFVAVIAIILLLGGGTLTYKIYELRAELRDVRLELSIATDDVIKINRTHQRALEQRVKMRERLLGKLRQSLKIAEGARDEIEERDSTITALYQRLGNAQDELRDAHRAAENTRRDAEDQVADLKNEIAANEMKIDQLKRMMAKSGVLPTSELQLRTAEYISGLEASSGSRLDFECSRRKNYERYYENRRVFDENDTELNPEQRQATKNELRRLEEKLKDAVTRHCTESSTSPAPASASQ